MKMIPRIFLLVLVTVGLAAAQTPQAITLSPDVVKIEANASNGFTYPYYLHVPAELRDARERGKTQTLMVLPNNTGKLDDALTIHDDSAKRQIELSRRSAAMVGMATLVPVFPRPASDWKVYTHALDRDSMITYRKELARFDLQLIAMIDDARERLAKEDLKIDKRVFIRGFSASGMFTNRFTFLHPERVKASVVGSPGGWPIAPVEKFGGKRLRYPIGTADIKTVSGEKLDIKALRKVPMFVFLGDKDDNDSVIFGDSYEEEDKEIIFALFGEKPVDRWEKIRAIYADEKLNATFKLYPGIDHTVTIEQFNDIIEFLKSHK